jgi:hypothetical protein
LTTTLCIRKKDPLFEKMVLGQNVFIQEQHTI